MKSGGKLQSFGSSCLVAASVFWMEGQSACFLLELISRNTFCLFSDFPKDTVVVDKEGGVVTVFYLIVLTGLNTRE